MPAKGFAGCLLCVLACTFTSGCAPITGRLADDPLLISKKPVQGRADAQLDPVVAYSEPSPPKLPAQAYLDRTPSDHQFAGGRPNLDLVKSPQKSSSFDSVADSAPVPPAAGAVQAITVARRKSPGIYAHAPDYSWLQGLVDQSANDHLVIRYAVVPSEDPEGGRAKLEDDPRLAQIRVGDVILVEGELLPQAAKPEGLNAGRSYRVKNVWLIRRAD